VGKYFDLLRINVIREISIQAVSSLKSGDYKLQRLSKGCTNDKLEPINLDTRFMRHSRPIITARYTQNYFVNMCDCRV